MIPTSNMLRRSKHHELKTDSAVFEAVVNGRKTYEIRRDDRNYQAGDVLVLRETRQTGEEMQAGATLEYTGRKHYARISHVLRNPSYGVADGWAILSLHSVGDGGEGEMERDGIYVASKSKHADMWKRFRDAGYPIISTWLDESAPNATLSWGDLWRRCGDEASHRDLLTGLLFQFTPGDSGRFSRLIAENGMTGSEPTPDGILPARFVALLDQSLAIPA